MLLKSASALALTAAIGLTSIQFTASAQEAADTDATTSEDQSVRRLTPVTVEARKREETLQDVPVVVTAFDRESLQRYNLDTFEDLATFTPGLQIGEAATQSGGVIALRGVSTGTTNPAFDQAVSIVMDGVAFSNAGLLRFSQIDGASVEVLKGPQALYFGKNSPGGIISLRSADPTDEFEASLRAAYEFEAEEKIVEGVVSGPLSDTVGGRVVVFYKDIGGIFKSEVNPSPISTDAGIGDRLPEIEEIFIRGTLKFDPTDAFSMTTKLSYAENDGGSYFQSNQLTFCPNGVAQLVPADRCRADGVSNYGGILPPLLNVLPRANGDATPRGNSETLIFTNNIDFDLSDTLTLTSVTGYMEQDGFTVANVLPGVSAGIFASTNNTALENFSQEFRLASNYDGPFNFMVGGLYSENTYEAITEVGLLAPTGPLPLNPPDPIYTSKSEAVSLFAQGMWDITETLELSGGLRWSEEDRSFDATEAGIEVTNIVSDRSFDDISPEATLKWQPDANSTYFVAYKEGFKSGGFNIVFRPGGYLSTPTTVVDQSYGQESVEGVEAGAKWTLLDGALQLNSAIYQYEYTDLQLSAFDPATLALTVQNAGKATVEGIEADFTYLAPVDGLLLRGGANFNEAKFDEFISPCWSGQLILGTGCDVPDGNGGFLQDLAGATLRNAPKWNANLGATYEHSLNDSMSLTWSSDIEYSSSYQTQIERHPGANQKELYRINANVTLASEAGWELAFIGRNLNNEYAKILTGEIAFPPAAAQDLFSSVSRGRQLMLQLKLNNDLFK